jgi:prepilin-type N-terminal cleavage/methylation domain-containing protein
MYTRTSHAAGPDRKGRSGAGFTLIEIMIVVLIIGILLAIALPNFVKARENSRAKSCVSNLMQIDSAKEQWAMDTRAAASASVDGAALWGAADVNARYLRNAPTCPSNGAYTVGAVGATPTCSIGANTAATPTDDHVLGAPAGPATP